MRRIVPLALLGLTGCITPVGGTRCLMDVDLDGRCDDADTCPMDPDNDADGDGICGDVDACPEVDDAIDADEDGIADACDVCPQDAGNDANGDGVCGDVDPCPDDAPEDCRVPIVVAIQADVFPEDVTWSVLDHRGSAVDIDGPGTFTETGEGGFHEVEVRPDLQSCVSIRDTGRDGGTRGLVFVRTGPGKGRRLARWDFADRDVSSFCFDPSAGQPFEPPKEGDWLDGGACEVQLEVHTGLYAAEIGWMLANEDDRTFVESPSYTTDQDTDLRTLVLTDGRYTFTMTDAYGDGWDGATYTFRIPGGAILGSGTLEGGALGTVDVTIDCD